MAGSFEDELTRELARLRAWLLEKHQLHRAPAEQRAPIPQRALIEHTPIMTLHNPPMRTTLTVPNLGKKDGDSSSSSDSDEAELRRESVMPEEMVSFQRRQSHATRRPSIGGERGNHALRRRASCLDVGHEDDGRARRRGSVQPTSFKAMIGNQDARRMSRSFHKAGLELAGADGRNRRRSMTEHPDSDTLQSKILALQDFMAARGEALRTGEEEPESPISPMPAKSGSAVSCAPAQSASGLPAQSASGIHHPRRASVSSMGSLESNLEQEFKVLPLWLQMKRHRRNSLGSAGGRQDYFSVDDGEETLSSGTLRRFIIAPGSAVQVSWDLLGLLLLAWDCIWLPLQIVVGADRGDSQFLLFLSWFSRIYWTLYMFTSCATGYFDSLGRMELRPQKVVQRYMSTWLSFDLLLCGADWLDEYSASASELEHLKSGSLMRSLRIVRTVRLLRMIRAPQMWRFITDQIPEELILVAHMCKVMGAMVLFAHFLGCAWFGIGEGDGGWVVQNQLLQVPVEERYLISVHWSVSVFAGETFILPVNDFERMFTVVALIFSMIFSAAMVSSITTAMTRLQIISSASSSSLAQLRKYLRDRQIKARLSMRVQRNAQHVIAAQKKNVPEENVDLLKVISNPLMVELHFEVYSRVLLEHAFMSCFCNFNPAGMRKVCHGAVATARLSSGDVLFSDLEQPTKPRMFFISDGELQYTQKSGKTRTLRHGASAAESVLWTEWAHCGTLRATAHTDLIELDAVKFEAVLEAFPMSHVGRYAEAYVNILNSTCRSELDDTGDFLIDYLLQILAYAFPELMTAGAGRNMANRISQRTSSRQQEVFEDSSFDVTAEAQGSVDLRALNMQKSSNNNLMQRETISRVGNSIRGLLRPSAVAGAEFGSQGSRGHASSRFLMPSSAASLFRRTQNEQEPVVPF